MPPWANGKNGKEYRSTMGRKPIGGIFSVGVEEPYRWKDSVQSAPEIRMWVLDGIANGLRPWFTKFAGTLHDHRWLKVVEDLYGWHYRNERYLRNEEPLARVAMVYSQQTAHYYGGEQARQKVEDHTLGYYQALIEARIPFEMVHDRLLDAAHIDQFKVLDPPQHRGALRRAVRADPRRTWSAAAASWPRTRRRSTTSGACARAISDWPTCSARRTAASVDARMQNSYLTLEKDPATGKRHPLLAGLEDAERIINGVSRVHTRTTGDLSEPAAHADSVLSGSADGRRSIPRVPKTDIPEVFVREAGKGRVVYFPWDIDRTFWEVLSRRSRQAAAQRRRMGGQ